MRVNAFCNGNGEHRKITDEEDKDQRETTFSKKKEKLKESKPVVTVRNKNNGCESGQKNEYLETAGKMERG